MKKLMEQIAEELSAAFEKSGYDGSLRISVQRCYGRSQSVQEGTVYDR